jgi:hypothetical protein
MLVLISVSTAERISSVEKSSELVGIRTRNLPACNIELQLPCTNTLQLCKNTNTPRVAIAYLDVMML